MAHFYNMRKISFRKNIAKEYEAITDLPKGSGAVTQLFCNFAPVRHHSGIEKK